MNPTLRYNDDANYSTKNLKGGYTGNNFFDIMYT